MTVSSFRESVLSFRGLLPCAFALIAGCGGISVDAEHDPAVDFARFRTFSWYAPPENANTAVTDTGMLALVASELKAKGLQESRNNPDLLVVVQRSLAGTMNTKSWGYSMHDGHLSRDQLQEGTLVIDLVDARSGQGVWRGTANGLFRADSNRAERQEIVAEVLHDMFADYPPRQ